jgi:hypothetical protein
MLAITSPTSGGRSVGIVGSRTQTMEFFFNHTCLFTPLFQLKLETDNETEQE